MKEKVLQLLQSSHFSDVLIAIQLSYKLPFEEFHSIFGTTLRIKSLPTDKPFYYFMRNNLLYFVGSAYIGRSNIEYATLEEFKRDFLYDSYTNLTPDNYGTIE